MDILGASLERYQTTKLQLMCRYRSRVCQPVPLLQKAWVDRCIDTLGQQYAKIAGRANRITSVSHNKSQREEPETTHANELELSRLLDAASARANRRHWDDDAGAYHERHASYLSGFYWCPEMLSEEDAQLLGDVSGQYVLEIGCGSAPCSSWLQNHYPEGIVTATDISMGMLEKADRNVSLTQANALELPYRDESFHTVFSAFGAIPFIRDITALYTEVARTLKPHGTFVFAVNHPMRWIFPDDPGEAGLQASISYFEKEYLETDDSNTVTYAEFQHTIADHINALSAAGFTITGCLEPEWPDHLSENWGQWSPLRGKIFPGSIIFSAKKI